MKTYILLLINVLVLLLSHQHLDPMVTHVYFQVPRGLPYFAVDFGLQGGFAHVIENEQKFPHYFGKVSVARLPTCRILFSECD